MISNRHYGPKTVPNIILIKKWQRKHFLSDIQIHDLLIDELRFIDNKCIIVKGNDNYDYAKSLLLILKHYITKEDKCYLQELILKYKDNSVGYLALECYFNLKLYNISDPFVKSFLDKDRFDIDSDKELSNFFERFIVIFSFGEDISKDKILEIRKMACYIDCYKFNSFFMLKEFDDVLIKNDSKYLGSKLRRELVRDYRDNQSCMYCSDNTYDDNKEWMEFQVNIGERLPAPVIDDMVLNKEIVPAVIVDKIKEILLWRPDGSNVNVDSRYEQMKMLQKKESLCNYQIATVLKSIIIDAACSKDCKYANSKLVFQAIKIMPFYGDKNMLNDMENLVDKKSFVFVDKYNGISIDHYCLSRQALIQACLRMANHKMSPTMIKIMLDNNCYDQVIICHELVLAWHDAVYWGDKDKAKNIESFLLSYVYDLDNYSYSIVDSFLVKNNNKYFCSEERKNNLKQRLFKLQSLDIGKYRDAEGAYIIMAYGNLEKMFPMKSR